MRYILIGLLSWPLVFCLKPFIGAWSNMAALVLVPILWAAAWRHEFGTWKIWQQGGKP